MHSTKQLTKAVAERQADPHLVEIQRRFRCHVCGQPGSGPTVEVVVAGFQGVGWLDWTTPADLRRCEACGRWACAGHLIGQQCQDCTSRPIDGGGGAS